MKPRGRQPGTLIRCTCRICKKVELASGCGGYYRCATCIESNLRVPSRGNTNDLGKLQAQAVVSRMVKSGQLLSPIGLNCADCNGPACEYEHRDYNHPTKVEPICRRCNLKRGPGIPFVGGFEAAVARGHAPYHLRISVQKLFAHVGIDFPRLQSMPRKLGVAEWLEILPVWTQHQAHRTHLKAA